MLTPLEADNLTILSGIRHGFFTRQGGTSRGLYASLNCGQGSKDDSVAVVENRARVARHLGSPGDDVQTLHQVHSATALVVDALAPRETLPKADALVTKTRGLAVGVLTADCTPVLFADPDARVVAAAHAGWRGALGGRSRGHRCRHGEHWRRQEAHPRGIRSLDRSQVLRGRARVRG